MAKYIHKYYYFYKITNLLNEHYYYGVHQTDNIDDGYMGSGNRLHRAYKKYGIENFKKEILKYFDNAEDMYNYEELIVTEELTKDEECYNIIKGGLGAKHPFSTYNSKGKVAVKNAEGEVFVVSVNDERYKSGELIHIWKGRKHDDEAKRKMSQHHKIYKQQAGEKNSQYGVRYVSKKNIDGKWQTIRISKDKLDAYLADGWIKANVVKYKDDDINLKFELKRERKIEEERKKKEKREAKYSENKNMILDLEKNSNIDFTKFGWVNLAHNYLKTKFDNYDISMPNALHRFIKRYDSEFFERVNAFVRK